MKCPRCEEGILETIKFRKIAKLAKRCSFCHVVWFADERIVATTGHVIRFAVEETELDEYSDVDQDHLPVDVIRHL
ncbi:MAG TPA: hypothetical protein VLF20_03710 [Patescibacteria group bacterium]|nr:hypothetical protein [Patescibacteria group bacterium]